MFQFSQAQTVMPIGPGPFVKLPCLGVLKHLTQNFVSHLAGKGLNVVVVPDIHDLRDHAFGHGH